jgi:hypothetical protein
MARRWCSNEVTGGPCTGADPYVAGWKGSDETDKSRGLSRYALRDNHTAKVSTVIKVQRRLGALVPFGTAMVPPRLSVSSVDDAHRHDLVVDVEVEDGQLLCRQVRVTARPGGPPITGESLRGLPIERLMRLGIATAAMMRDTSASIGSARLRSASAIEKDAVARAARGPRGRPAGPTLETRALAVRLHQRHRGLVNAGVKQPRKVIVAELADAGQPYTPSRVSALIKMGRDITEGENQ